MISDYYIENQNHILGELQKYEIWLPKEKRHRRGLKVTATLDEVNKRLPDLIAELESVYKQNEPLKAVSSGVVERKSANKVAMPVKSKHDMSSLIVDIQQRIVALGVEIDYIAEELEKMTNQKVA